MTRPQSRSAVRPSSVDGRMATRCLAPVDSPGRPPGPCRRRVSSWMAPGTATWSGRWPPAAQQRRLAYFDQEAVRVMEVAADLRLMLLGWCQEVRPALPPLVVDSMDVRDPDVEEAAHEVRVARRFEGDSRLVIGRSSADVDDDPAVRERDVRDLVAPLSGDDGCAAQDVRVEVSGSGDILGNDEVSQDHLVVRARHGDLREGREAQSR